jgi:hypothetical protein
MVQLASPPLGERSAVNPPGGELDADDLPTDERAS